MSVKLCNISWKHIFSKAFDHIEHNPRSFNHLIDSFAFNQFESTYTDHVSASKDWYQTTTVIGHNFLNNRLADIQLKQLGFWSYTRNFSRSSFLPLCLQCQQGYKPVHYLVNCSAHTMYQRKLKDHLLLCEDYTPPDHHRAALIINTRHHHFTSPERTIETPPSTI